MPLHRLLPQCQVQINYENGKSEALSYDWHRDVPRQLASPWTGVTIFQIRTAQEHGLINQHHRRKLRSELRQAAQVFSIEKQIYMTMNENMGRSRARADILATSAGQGNFTCRAGELGLITLRPLDINDGCELSTPEGQRHVDYMLQRFRPLVLIQTILQDNVNHIDRKIKWSARSRRARSLLKKALEWCMIQMEQGRYFLLTNSITSRVWLEPAVQKLLKRPGVFNVICHSGASNSNGQMIKKGFRFVGNCPEVLQRLQGRLFSDELKPCVPLQEEQLGQNDRAKNLRHKENGVPKRVCTGQDGPPTTLRRKESGVPKFVSAPNTAICSQHYPVDMVSEILLGVRELAERRYPERFQQPSQPWQVNATFQDDPVVWAPVFQLAQETFDNSRQRSMVLPTSDKIWKLVQQLCGWHRLERVQIALNPAVRRFTTHIPHVTRGEAILYNDGTSSIQQEDLHDVRHPRGRFSKPVHIGIFFIGASSDPNLDPYPQGDPGPVDDNPQHALQHAQHPDISFPNGPKMTTAMRTAVCRLHKNLGHPRPQELKKLLAMNNVKDQVIYDAVDKLVCDSCERTKGPLRPPLGRAPPDGYPQFADALQMDIIYVRDIKAVNHIILGVICECTHLHVAILLDSRLPEEVNQKFQTQWVQNFGFPLKIKTDPDGSFRSTFEAAMDAAGVFMDYVPAEDHSKMGLIERHNATMRDLMERIIDSQAVAGKENMRLAAVAATFAKNSATWSSGRPPFIAAFGRIPRIGLNLLSDEHGLVTGQTRDEAQRLADALRIEAQQHLAAMSIDSTFRRALLRKTAPQPQLDVPAGSVVAYWRWTARSGKKRGGYKLGRLLGQDPNGRSYWIQSGTNSIRVGAHQLRTARGFEAWCPDANDIRALREGSENFKLGEVIDEEIPQPLPDDQPDDYAVEFPDVHPENVAVPLPVASSAPGPKATSVEEEAVQTDPYQETVVNQHIEMNVSSPTYKQTIMQPTFGMTHLQQMQPVVQVPLRRRHARSRTPNRQAQITAPEQPALPIHPASAAPALQNAPAAPAASSSTAQASPPIDLTLEDEDDEGIGQSVPQTPPDLRLTPAKRAIGSEHGPAVGGQDTPPLVQAQEHTQEVSPDFQDGSQQEQNSQTFLAALDGLTVTDEGIAIIDDFNDGTAEAHMPWNNNNFHKAYQTSVDYDGDGTSDISDIEFEDMSKGPSNAASNPAMSRLEQKALEKEIPWRRIVETGGQFLEEFVKSAKAEEESWKAWHSVEPICQKEAEEIFKCPIRRRRILRSRAAYRDKSKGLSRVQAKTRVVALGHLDPDLSTLSRESATPMRQSEYLLYSIFIAGKNGKLLDYTTQWVLWAGDVKTAFLQGTPEERDQPLYLLPPQDGITKLAGTFNHPLFRVRGNLYGLASAPRTWTLHVVKTVKSAGFQQHSCDKMFFYLITRLPGDEHESLAAVLIAYVDDFLLAHSVKYDRQQFLSLFTWGRTEELSLENALEFKGKTITLKYSQNKQQYELSLTQQKFISGLKSGSVNKKRLKETLDPSDQSELRSVAGCLQWVAGQCRPEVASTVSLSSRGSKSTYEDLANMYRAVDHLIATPMNGLTILPVRINMATLVVSFADSSWANAEGHASQHGALVLLAEPQITDVQGQACLVDWKSSRSSRVCRSTLAAEASAADTSIDRAVFLNYMLSEIIHNKPSFQVPSLLRTIQVTDCRSLYDVLCSENPNTEEKRTIITVRSMQQVVSRADVFWVPTIFQWADSLTKISWDLMRSFSEWLSSPWVKLHE